MKEHFTSKIRPMDIAIAVFARVLTSEINPPNRSLNYKLEIGNNQVVVKLRSTLILGEPMQENMYEK